jgi:transcriptional regulator with XRE-family HTH domain
MSAKTKKEIGKELAKLRQKKGLFASFVANELSVNRSLISNIESGRRYPSHNLLLRMLRLYGALSKLKFFESRIHSILVGHWKDKE